MKVLLIQSSLEREEKPVYPLGLSYLASAIRNKHSCEILDANFVSRDEIQKKVESYRPDIIGLGIRNIDTGQSFDTYFYFDHFPPFVKWIKQISNGTALVVGGSGFSIFPREILHVCPEIDFGVNLEGEETFPKLLDNLNNPETVPGVFYRDGGEILFTGAGHFPDFGLLPPPFRLSDLKPYQDETYQLGIQTKRGCALRCLYCNYPYLNGNMMRLRNPKDVVGEMSHLKREHQIKRIYFADSVFNEPKEYAEEICREMLDQGLQLKWSAFFSMRGFDQSFKELASQAGCEMFDFSPDGLSQNTLNVLGKGITEEQLNNVINLFKGSDYPHLGIGLMFNVPKVGFRDIWLILRAILFWPLKFPALKYVGVTNMRIYPHTPLHNLALDKGLVSPMDNLFRPVYYDPWPLKPISVLLYYARRIKRRIMKLCGHSFSRGD